jgi:type I restriction enzyme S subunit
MKKTKELTTALVPEAEQPYPIPKNWVWTRLAAGFEEVKEKTIPTGESDLSFIGLEHLQSGGGITGTGASKNVKSTKTMFKAGDVLYGKLRPYLNKHALVNFGGIASTDILIFRPKGVLDSRLLDNYLGLSHVVAYAQSKSKGINLPRVSPQVINNLPVPLPPLPEQQRIAEKLESLLGKIKQAKVLLDEIPGILQNFRLSVLAAACSGRLTEDWRAENPDINATKKISKENESGSVPNDTQLFQIPNNWAWKKVGDICTVITGKTPPTADPKYTESNDLPFITPAAFNMGDRLSYSERYVSDAAVKVAPLIPAKSVLLTSIGATLGKVAFLEVPAVVNQQINALIPRVIEAVYIFRWTCSQSFQEMMWAKSSATTLPIINKSRCEQLPIPVPPLPEQQEIVRRVESLFSKADELEAQYRYAMELIESLLEIILSKAFRGKLVPQDPNDESAFGLLERITFEKEKHETEKVEGTKRKKHKQNV